MARHKQNVLPTLDELALSVSDGSVSLTQALSRLNDANEEDLSNRLNDALKDTQNLIREDATDMLYQRAFFELGFAVSQRVNSANGLLNFGLNLGKFLCIQLGEVERGVGLMDTAIQQIQFGSIEFSELAKVILEVSDVYLNFHERLGPEYMKMAEKYYRTVLQLPNVQQFEPNLIARAELGIGLCLANQWEDGRMPNAEEAITHYRQALQYLNPDLNPRLFSLVMHNLGNAYRMRTEGDRAHNLKMAADCLRSALEVRERTGSPDRVRYTSSILAEVEGEMGHPFQAIALFEKALESLNPVHERLEFCRLHLRLAAYSFRTPHFTWLSEDQFKKIARASYVVARESADPERDTDLWAAASAGLAMVWADAGRIDDALSLQAELLSRLDPQKFGHRCAVIASDYIQILSLRVQQCLRQNDRQRAQSDQNIAHAAAHFVQNGEIKPYRKAFIAATLESNDVLLAQDESERAHHLRRQHEFLKQAQDALTSSVSRYEIEAIQSDMISVSKRLNQTSVILEIAHEHLAQEPSFLRMRPSLVDYYNFSKNMHRYWDIG